RPGRIPPPPHARPGPRTLGQGTPRSHRRRIAPAPPGRTGSTSAPARGPAPRAVRPGQLLWARRRSSSPRIGAAPPDRSLVNAAAAFIDRRTRNLGKELEKSTAKDEEESGQSPSSGLQIRFATACPR